MSGILKPIHYIIVQHPFVSVLTVAVLLWICVPVFLYIFAKIAALIKFFKGEH